MKDIKINVRLAEGSPQLGCIDDTKIIGAMWDNHAQRLIFDRDPSFADYNMMLRFETGGEKTEVNVGTNNTYEITSALTQSSILKLGVSFYEGTNFLSGSVNTLNFMYAMSTQIGDLSPETINQYLALLTVAEQQSAAATAAAEKAQTAYDALASTDLTAIQATLSSLNDSLVNNYGGTNLLSGTKDFSSVSSKTYVTTDIFRDHLVWHCDKSSDDSSTYASLEWVGVIEPEPDTWYTLSFWAKGTGVLNSYFFLSGVSTVQTGISSTGATNIAADGRVITTVTSEWKRYWISWKTVSPISSGLRNVLAARVFGGNDIYVCGVRVERGQYAHDWNYSLKDIATNASLASKRDNQNGYAYSNAVATTTWFRLARVSPSAYNNEKLLFSATYLSAGSEYVAIISLSIRWEVYAVINSGSTKLSVLASTNDAFALSNYLYAVIEDGGYVSIYCLTNAMYSGWRIDLIKDVNGLNGGNDNSRVAFYSYSSGTASGAETTEPSGTKLLPANALNARLAKIEAAIVALGGSI